MYLFPTATSQNAVVVFKSMAAVLSANSRLEPLQFWEKVPQQTL